MEPELENLFSSDDLGRLQAQLSCWIGAEALVVTLTRSHRQLELELWKPGEPMRLTVVCVGPSYFAGPLQWSDARLHVSRLEPRVVDELVFDWYQLMDQVAGVRLQCDSIQAILRPAMSWQRHP